QEVDAVPLVAVDRLSLIASRGHMVPRPGKVDSQQSGHASRIDNQREMSTPMFREQIRPHCHDDDPTATTTLLPRRPYCHDDPTATTTPLPRPRPHCHDPTATLPHVPDPTALPHLTPLPYHCLTSDPTAFPLAPLPSQLQCPQSLT